MPTPKFASAVAAVLLFAAACGSPRPAATATLSAATPTSAPTSQPAATAEGEVVKLAGDTWFNSEPIKLASDATLKITWDYTGTGPFALWLVNTAEEVLDPAYDRILITDAAGATAGSSEHPLIAGEYELEVEMAEGPWTVEIQSVK